MRPYGATGMIGSVEFFSNVDGPKAPPPPAQVCPSGRGMLGRIPDAVSSASREVTMSADDRVTRRGLRPASDRDTRRGLRPASDRVDPTVSRRRFLGGAAAFAGAAAGASELLGSRDAEAAPASLAASPPPGFAPMAAPGKIVKVSKADTLMPNGLFPKEDAA